MTENGFSIFGIDFTSAPTHRKSITSARCTFSCDELTIVDCLALPHFSAFEALLEQPGPWVAACDFPFGLPLQLLENLRWPLSWEAYIHHISTLGKDGFCLQLANYSASQPSGDKLHLRVADRIAGARSPMMMYRVPVGKMFFAGAPRLLASGVCVMPCRPQGDMQDICNTWGTENAKGTRVVLEGYPALVARRWLGKRSYKSDERKKQTDEHMLARRQLVVAIRSAELASHYGLRLVLADALAEQLIQEPMGDQLDAVLCAIQAAWAYKQRAKAGYHYGIPSGFECEGWIVDPATLDSFMSAQLPAN